MADNNGKIELEKNFQVYVGIDFGTDGTGLAYALNTGEVFVHQKWKGYQRSVEVKPKTRILLDKDGKFLAFGQPATNSYITMGDKNGWMLFERFKMALYDKNEEDEDDENKQKDICDELTAINGAKFPADRVFIEALKYIKSQVFKYFKKNKLQIESIDSVQWILTVPAIWSEKAKYKMEQWAHKAELTNKQIPNHLKIVYEPDCASLSIQYEIHKLKQDKNEKLSINENEGKQEEEAEKEEKNKENIIEQNEEEKDGNNEMDENDENDAAENIENIENNENNENNQIDENNGNNGNNDEQNDENSNNENNNNIENNNIENNNIENNNDNNDVQNKESESENVDNKLIKGEKYILIDAGGGTCDVACHEILGNFAVKEVVYPTGGRWGSTYIDDEYVVLLHKIFSKSWIDEFTKEDASSYAELIDNFRVAKQEFWREGDDLSDIENKWHNVQLPFDFCTFLEEKIQEDDDAGDLEELVEKTEAVSLEDEYLKLHYSVWRQLFDCVVDPILKHCTHLLTTTIMKDDTNYICLVGGLGSSKYLQHRIRSSFGSLSEYKLEIIIPKRPILSVVDGAARFGLQPDYIQARTLAKTYGNAIDPKIEVIDTDMLPPGYLEKNQYRCDHSNILRVRNIFSIYARKNQTIHIRDKPIIKKYKRFNTKQKKVRISIFSSDEEDPKVVTNKPCAKTTVIFPPNSTELSIIVELLFSDTKIRVFAFPEDDPQNKKEMELDYEYK